MPIQAVVVGCGNFARAIHLPNLQASPDYALRAVVDVDPDLARRTAEQFGASYSSTDYQTVLDDAEVELVVICTPHNLHAPQSLAAVSAGKHVLVEKPMAMRREELGPLVDAVAEKGVTFTVGFNRRYSSLARKAKKLLDGRQFPLLMTYRMVDEVWRHPWALDPQRGGGRLISEAVHLFDFCAYMIGEEPERIFAEGGALTHPEIAGTQDNAVITMKHADGSIVSITIGDLGSPAYPKERIEMFFGKRTALIDNFERLEVRGVEGEQGMALPSMDKGFVQELAELARAINSRSPALVTEIDGARATLCALGAIEAIRTGRPQTIALAEALSDRRPAEEPESVHRTCVR
jgi:predicted dehydrogenase